MAIVFKIRRKSDGLFSMGGSTPSFSKTGKIWKQKGHVTSHLTNVARYGYRSNNVYSDCEIVPYELVETPAGPGVTIQEYLAELKQRDRDREEAHRLRNEKYQKEQRRKEFEKLRKEFGDPTD